MTRLILDVDTGIDDALALAYLATFDTVDVLGVIGTYGNVSVDTAVRNTSYVLERLGLRHIPVIRGSSHPSWARCFIPDAGCAQFHGTDGLGGFGPACDSSSSDTAFSDIFSDNSGSDTVFSRDYRSLISVGGYALDDVHANPAVDSFELSLTTDSASFIHADDSSADSVSEGVQFIIDQVRAYGFDVTVVTTGPLTDIDAAIAAAPDIAGKLKLVMMGGTLTQEGNCWDLTAETNIIQDPEAADRVFHSGADITMVGLDVTHQCLMGSDATCTWREAANADTLGGSAGNSNAASARTASSDSSPSASDVRVFLADMADFSIAANYKADARLFSQGMPLHDPLAAAVAVDPSLVTCINLPMKVELETGDFHGTRGRTIGDPAGLIDPNAPRIHVALQVDSHRFVSDFTTRIKSLQ
ncbi:MAG: nucleoside hydrolase [Bifidobacterium catenulatum]